MNQKEIDALVIGIKQATYVCEVCGKVVFPSVSVSADEIKIVQEKPDITDLKGNRKILKNLCNECKKSFSMMDEEEELYRL